MTQYDEFASEQIDPVIMVDSEGVITYINSSFEKTFKWPSQELIGKPLVTIIPPNLRDAHNMGFSKYIITRISTLLNKQASLEIQLGNGDIMLAKHYIAALQKGDTTVMAAKITLRDT